MEQEESQFSKEIQTAAIHRVNTMSVLRKLEARERSNFLNSGRQMHQDQACRCGRLASQQAELLSMHDLNSIIFRIFEAQADQNKPDILSDKYFDIDTSLTKRILQVQRNLLQDLDRYATNQGQVGLALCWTH